MKSISSVLIPRLQIFAILCVSVPILTACAKPNVPVSIHGVNYSEEAFSYFLVDPLNSDNQGGGELVDAFSAGGTVCCFSLPRKWRTGLKVEIRSTHWLKELPDRTLPEVKSTHVVDVPNYVDNKPGELWVLRAADGTMSLVSSNAQPDHASWPGKVKGWPVPSKAYQLERWELYRKHEADGVVFYESLLEELRLFPLKRATEAWDFARKDDPGSLQAFEGAHDVAYHNWLKKDYEESLERSRTELRRVMEWKP